MRNLILSALAIILFTGMVAKEGQNPPPLPLVLSLQNSPIFRADCPPAVAVEQRAFWDQMTKAAGKNDVVDEMAVACFVVNPPVSVKDMQECNFFKSFKAPYPEVVMPPVVANYVLHAIYGVAFTPTQFEFIEMLYSAKTGNMILLKVNVSRPEGK